MYYHQTGNGHREGIKAKLAKGKHSTDAAKEVTGKMLLDDGPEGNITQAISQTLNC